MCTMTWIMREDGYDLFFNRDESRKRLVAFPPEVRDLNGVRYLAPIDQDAGGTWMGANEYGLSVCIMNGRPPRPLPPISFTSRGLLVMSLMDCRDTRMAIARLQDMDLTAYRAFRLIFLTPGQPVAACEWNGFDEPVKTVAEVSLPLVSSSFRLGEVSELREQLFRSLEQTDPDALAAFHRSHVPEAGPYSVCMHREDARSVSLSRVRVNAAQIDFWYAPGPPCRTDFLPPFSLVRTSI